MSRFTAVAIAVSICALGLPPLTGCAPLSPGADADQEQRTVGEVADDFNISSAVRARLIRDEQVRFRDISVETRRGVVTLFGHVATAEVEQRAMDLARGIPNVVSVQSRLVVLEAEGQ